MELIRHAAAGIQQALPAGGARHEALGRVS